MRKSDVMPDGTRYPTDNTNDTRKSRRGFAAMPAEKRRAIARKGGQAVQQKGTAHQFSSEEARLAGRKGGIAISKDRRYMAGIGRKGGRTTARKLSFRTGGEDADLPESLNE